MAENKNAKLLLRVQSDEDAAMAYRRWPATAKLPLRINDELYEVTPPIPMMPKLFSVLREGQEILGCMLSEAEKK